MPTPQPKSVSPAAAAAPAAQPQKSAPKAVTPTPKPAAPATPPPPPAPAPEAVAAEAEGTQEKKRLEKLADFPEEGITVYKRVAMTKEGEPFEQFVLRDRDNNFVEAPTKAGQTAFTPEDIARLYTGEQLRLPMPQAEGAASRATKFLVFEGTPMEDGGFKKLKIDMAKAILKSPGDINSELLGYEIKVPGETKETDRYVSAWLKGALPEGMEPLTLREAKTLCDGGTISRDSNGRDWSCTGTIEERPGKVGTKSEGFVSHALHVEWPKREVQQAPQGNRFAQAPRQQQGGGYRR